MVVDPTGRSHLIMRPYCSLTFRDLEVPNAAPEEAR